MKGAAGGEGDTRKGEGGAGNAGVAPVGAAINRHLQQFVVAEGNGERAADGLSGGFGDEVCAV